jgi:hypothetical protein
MSLLAAEAFFFLPRPSDAKDTTPAKRNRPNNIVFARRPGRYVKKELSIWYKNNKQEYGSKVDFLFFFWPFAQV